MNTSLSLFENAYLQRIEIIEQSDKINLAAINALRIVIESVFCRIANVFFITISSDNAAVQFWLYDAMEKLLISCSCLLVQLIVLDKKPTKPDLQGKQYCNMILIDSFESLEKTSIANNNKNSDGVEYYFIFLQISDEFAAKEMKKIFKYCFENYWLHCNVMVQNKKGEVLIYTYFPFKDQQCFQTQPQLINEFKNGRFINSVIFPDKLKNLHCCPLKVTTWIVPPFVINKASKLLFDKPTSSHLSGFEMNILTAISRVMNFTLNINVISIDTYYKNQTPASLPIEMVSNCLSLLSRRALRTKCFRCLVLI